MVNVGTAKTRTLSDKWTVVTADAKRSAHFEHTVAITEARTADIDAVDKTGDMEKERRETFSCLPIQNWRFQCALLDFAIAALCVASLSALNVSAQTAPVVADLIKDVDGVSQKFIALAKAMPADKFAWRPVTGVRSVGEVFLHVSSDNYLLPALGGTAMPASTKLNMKDFATFTAYEKRPLTREQIVADMETSFAHLKAAMQKTTAPMFPNVLDFFGSEVDAAGFVDWHDDAPP